MPPANVGSGCCQLGGGFVVLDAASLRVVYEDPKPKGSVSDVRFNLAGDQLAVACTNFNIYIVACPGFAVRTVLSGVSAIASACLLALRAPLHAAAALT